MSRAHATKDLHADLALQPGDEVWTKRELATFLGLSVRTIERSDCPVLLNEQREGAQGVRFRRRYIQRIARAHFSGQICNPRAPRRLSGRTR